MQKNEPIQLCLVTWVAHNSRISDRMEAVLPKEFIEGLKPHIFSRSEQIKIVRLIAEGIGRYSIPTCTFNVLPDHVHILVGARSEKDLSHKIGKLKGYTSYSFRKEEHIQSRIWARKFNSQWITDESHLASVITYIDHNHLKHEASWKKEYICGFGPELKTILLESTMSAEEILRLP